MLKAYAFRSHAMQGQDSAESQSGNTLLVRREWMQSGAEPLQKQGTSAYIWKQEHVCTSNKEEVFREAWNLSVIWVLFYIKTADSTNC